MNEILYESYYGIDDSASLYHHGVLGMKWGVRRYQNKDGSLIHPKSKRKAKTADQRKRESMLKASNNRRSLSDADLNKRIERIKKERELKRLTDEECKPGRTFIKQVLSNSGRRAVTTIMTGAMLYGAKVLLTKHFDPMDAAKYLTPRPKEK